MNCPTCGGPTAIYCTKKEKDHVTRYRKCLNCNYHKFSTVEKLYEYEVPPIEEPQPVVVEKEPVTIKEKRKKTERNLIVKALTDICKGFIK